MTPAFTRQPDAFDRRQQHQSRRQQRQQLRRDNYDYDYDFYDSDRSYDYYNTSPSPATDHSFRDVTDDSRDDSGLCVQRIRVGPV